MPAQFGLDFRPAGQRIGEPVFDVIPGTSRVTRFIPGQDPIYNLTGNRPGPPTRSYGWGPGDLGNEFYPGSRAPAPQPITQQAAIPGPRTAARMGRAGVDMQRIRSAARLAGRGFGLELAFGGALTVAGGFMGAAQWGARTGLEEDYVGGAVYGASKEFGANFLGAIPGAFIGGFVGSFGGPIGATIGAMAGGIAGYLGGSSLADPVARNLGFAARAITRDLRTTDRIQFGGDFRDTRAAYTMRQSAVMEMSASMLNARQYLGNEAAFLHER